METIKLELNRQEAEMLYNLCLEAQMKAEKQGGNPENSAEQSAEFMSLSTVYEGIRQAIGLQLA